jgi:hypothetical protein
VPKKRYRNPSILSISLLVFTLLFPTACGTLEVGVERTATPDQAATATVAALATENARLSAQATMLASTPTSTPFPATPTPTPGLGTVTGRICFPSERIPAMTAYFQNRRLHCLCLAARFRNGWIVLRVCAMWPGGRLH